MTGVAPASTGQRLLWFLDHYQSESSINCPLVCRIRGEAGEVVPFTVGIHRPEGDDRECLPTSLPSVRSDRLPVALGADPKAAAVWLASDVQKILKRTSGTVTDCPLSPDRLAELLRLLIS